MSWIERRRASHPVQCHVCAYVTWVGVFSFIAWMMRGDFGLAGEAFRVALGL